MRRRVSFIVQLDVDPEETQELEVDIADILQHKFSGVVYHVVLNNLWNIDWIQPNGQYFGDPIDVEKVVNVSAIASGYEWMCNRCHALNEMIEQVREGSVLECHICRQSHTITEYYEAYE